MPVHMVRIEASSDGRERRLKFQPAPSTDPAVQSRLECQISPGEYEIATTFGSSRHRPRTYPASLPFIPGVKTHTNEFPGSERRPRARWSTFLRSRGILDEVVRQSIADGWTPDVAMDLPFLHGAVQKAFLRRSGHVRWVTEHRFRFLRLIQLEECAAEDVSRLSGRMDRPAR